MKILCCYTDDEAKVFFEKNIKEGISFYKGALNSFFSKKIYEETELMMVHVDSVVSVEKLNKFKKLKKILTYSTGVDHIDLDYCKKNNIEVENIKFYGSKSIAEHALALLFNVAKRLSYSEKEMKKKKTFLLKNRKDLRGFCLNEKKIGIIGTGGIGKEMVLLCRAIGMDVLVHDLKKNPDLTGLERVSYVEKKYLLSQSDILSLHLPLCSATRGFISKKEFEIMKKGIVLINTARGGLLNTKDFYDALLSGKVSGAGLDVLDDEQSIWKNFLRGEAKTLSKINKSILNMNNVLVSPHNAYNTVEAVSDLYKQASVKVNEYFAS